MVEIHTKLGLYSQALKILQSKDIEE